MLFQELQQHLKVRKSPTVEELIKIKGWEDKGCFKPLKQRGGFFPMKPCQSNQHYPPSHMVFPCAGHWVCPECGDETFIMGPATCVQL